jgi:hypothetical protein
MKKFLLSLGVLCVLCVSSPVAPAADLTVTAGNVVASKDAKLRSGTAGATVTAGQTVYYDTTANTYKLADANGATPDV